MGIKAQEESELFGAIGLINIWMKRKTLGDAPAVRRIWFGMNGMMAWVRIE